MGRLIAFVAAMTLTVSAFGQNDSVIGVITTTSEGDFSGSGVVVGDLGDNATHQGWYDCLVVTCAHVVANQTNVRLKFRNGSESRYAKILHINDADDIAILRGIGPKSMRVVAKIGNPAGETFTADGVQQSKVRASINHAGKSFFDGQVIAGDSGGGVFNSNGELVGVIQGGWFWLEDGKSTWPVRTAGRKMIEAAIQKARR